jgi:hypothetical protein
VTGIANLAGTLAVNLVNGFQPASGASFVVLTFGSHTGTFATLSEDGTLFTPAYDAGDVTLVRN